MKTLLIALLLLARAAYAAQPAIIVKEGTTSFGPIAVTQLHRFANFELDRNTNPGIRVTGVLFVSVDGGVTFLRDWTCTFSGAGTSRDLGPVIGTSCQLPKDATHVSGTLTVTGGQISISRAVSLRGK